MLSSSRIGKAFTPSSDALVLLLRLWLLLSSSLESCPLLVSCFTTTSTSVWGRRHTVGGKPSFSSVTKKSTTISTPVCLHVYFTGMDNYREADGIEQSLGARRHDTMSVLPDSMVATTLFVGNLCEFVSDQDLSELFTTASHFLQFVPAVVIRKADLTSLQYGFVTFPSISEKEAALQQFHGYKWRGKRLKVEPIRDFVNTKTGKTQRVRIPERMVAYVSGAVKKPALASSSSSSYRTSSRSGSSGSGQNRAVVNTMRQATAMGTATTANTDTTRTTTKNKEAAAHRPLKAALQQSLVKQQQQQEIDYRKVLNNRDQSEYARAIKKGYVTFTGCGNKAGSTSYLAKFFRKWCNVRYKPNIRLYKATNGHAALDQVVIDISPLALYRRRLLEQQQQYDGNCKEVTTTTIAAAAEMLFQNDLLQYKEQVLLAATNHGMVVLNDDDNDDDDDDYSSNDSNGIGTVQKDKNNVKDNNVPSPPPVIWRTRAIMNIGIFQGERSQCRALAKELALQWEIPELLLSPTHQPPTTGNNGDDRSGNKQRSSSSSRPRRQVDDDDDDDEDDDERISSNNGLRRAKTKGLSRHRTRGGGHHQSWY